MRILTLLILLLTTSSSMASDGKIRSSIRRASQCFLFSYGKGPNGIVDLGLEIQLDYLKDKQPFIDDTKETKPDALVWTDAVTQPEVRIIGISNGKRIVRVDYNRKPLEEISKPQYPEEVSCVMLLFESETEWFRPFMVVSPELFQGRIIHSDTVSFAYTGSIYFSGTGGFSSHFMFDLSKELPILIKEFNGGRIKETDFKTETEYEKAIEKLDKEYKFVTTGT